MTKSCGVPSRSLMNAISLPTGEKRGDESLAEFVVSGLATPPSIGTVQMSPFQSNASCLPSGDRAGWFARRMRSLAEAGTQTRIATKVARRIRATEVAPGCEDLVKLL